MNTLNNIIPIPLKAETIQGELSVANLRGYTIQPDVPAEAAEKLAQISHALMLNWKESTDGQIVVALDSNLPEDGWKMQIALEKILICGASRVGLRYALEALLQMLLIATRDGAKKAQLTCGNLEDHPRFAWRGLLLDSARHFQRPEVVKQVLLLMSRCRLNKFHWHLIDSQGFRVPSRSFPKMSQLATFSGGCYTAEEIRDIEELAASLDIEIIPELDAPGHFGGFLQNYPEYACDPTQPGEECCLGNPKTLEMVKTIYRETLELLPRTKRIHVGGDEANSSNWEKCPCCQRAVQEKKFTGMRQLEHHFMAELKAYVRELGCQSITWSIPENKTQNFPMEFSKDDMIQTWLDLREPIFWAKQGNKVIYSLHSSLYLDYPMNFSESHEPWMFTVTEQSIYLCEPYGLWADQVKDTIVGTEACLWTETVPEWRVMQKLLPRLPAYAECCWSFPQRKDWYDFSRRREQLEGAGYFDLLRSFFYR